MIRSSRGLFAVRPAPAPFQEHVESDPTLDPVSHPPLRTLAQLCELSGSLHAEMASPAGTQVSNGAFLLIGTQRWPRVDAVGDFLEESQKYPPSPFVHKQHFNRHILQVPALQRPSVTAVLASCTWTAQSATKSERTAGEVTPRWRSLRQRSTQVRS